jgi:hypothetical protein
MLISSLPRLGRRRAVRLAPPGPDPQNESPAASPEPVLGESDWGPRAVPDPPLEAAEEMDWGARVAREVRHQEVIEASFDRAEAYARLGDFEHAVEWLDRAATLSGGLPPAYRAERARWDRTAAIRPTAARRDANVHGARAHAGAGR